MGVPDKMERNTKERIRELNRLKAKLEEKLENTTLPKHKWQRYIDQVEWIEEELYNLEGTMMYRRINNEAQFGGWK
jgi:hypothetical protein